MYNFSPDQMNQTTQVKETFCFSVFSLNSLSYRTQLYNSVIVGFEIVYHTVTVATFFISTDISRFTIVSIISFSFHSGLQLVT